MWCFMVKVYVYMSTGACRPSEGFVIGMMRGCWADADEKISPYFENPRFRGEYYIYCGEGHIKEITEPDPLKIKGAVHIASNFGLSAYGVDVYKTTNIVNPDRSEGYILYQGQMRIAKIIDNVESLAKLSSEPPRQSNTTTVRFVDSFEDILREFDDYKICVVNDAKSLAAFEEEFGLEGFR